MELNHLLEIVKGMSGSGYSALALDPDAKLDTQSLVQLRKDCGDSVLAVSNQLQMSSLIGRIGRAQEHDGLKAMQYTVVSGIPIKQYDLLVSDSMNVMQARAISALRPLFVIMQNHQGTIGDGYQHMMPGMFVRQDHVLRFQQYLNQQTEAEQVQQVIKGHEVDGDISDMGIQVQKLVPEQVSNQVQYQYLNQMKPGMVSIIVVINTKSQKVVSLIRQLKLQKLPQTQFIVINNGVQLKVAVGQKVAVHFKQPVQDSYCARVGRQLSSGQYIFTLYSESQVPDIQRCLMSGKFQTR